MKVNISRVRNPVFFLILGIFFSVFANQSAVAEPSKKSDAPYKLKKLLMRSEELFRANNYPTAIIFYYEALNLATSLKVKSKLHFRIGECLEALRRFDFAVYHYKKAIKGQLPDILVNRAIMKLEHLPELAQKEEAERLYNRAITLYKKRNVRGAIDDYLASLRLMPSLMAKDDSGLINDAIRYLTYLSESKDKEPARLLKLATLLELKGEVSKSKETLKQIVIIYPESDEAAQAEEKLDNYAGQKTAYLETQSPKDEVKEFLPSEKQVVIDKEFEFNGPGTISRNLSSVAFTLKASSERVGLPDNRFEDFTVILGTNEEQKEFTFNASDDISQKVYNFDTLNYYYSLTIVSLDQTVGYIQSLYGDGKEKVNLFSELRVHLKISQK